MNELIEFLLRETPGHAKEIQSDIGLLLSSIENTQNAIEGAMPSIEGDYAKIGEYYTMLRKLKKINEEISELEKMFGAKNAQEQEDEEELNSIQKTIPKNYDDCKVDESVSHGLFENYTHKRPVAFSLEGNKYSARDWKQILRIVCEVLNQKNSKIFDSFVRDKDMQGSSRIYFAYTDNRMYDGKKVSGSNIYIETNHNANGICSIIANMLEKYDIPVTSMQIYLRLDYSLIHNDDDNIKKKQETENELKIGQQAKTFFTQYFSDTTKYYDITNFLNKYWCNDNFGICYPLLKEIDESIPISKQKGYNDDYARYWTKPVLKINGKNFILCSQWFKEFKEKLNKWISEHPNADDITSKITIHVLPKTQVKTCLECSNKTEKEILLVKYHTDIADIENKLFTRRCHICGKIFIADTIFKTYSQGKNLNNMNVTFVKKDTN